MMLLKALHPSTQHEKAAQTKQGERGRLRNERWYPRRSGDPEVVHVDILARACIVVEAQCGGAETGDDAGLAGFTTMTPTRMTSDFWPQARPRPFR